MKSNTLAFLSSNAKGGSQGETVRTSCTKIRDDATLRLSEMTATLAHSRECLIQRLVLCNDTGNIEGAFCNPHGSMSLLKSQLDPRKIAEYILQAHHVCTDSVVSSLFSASLTDRPMIASSKHGASNIRPLGTIRIVGTRMDIHNIRVPTA